MKNKQTKYWYVVFKGRQPGIYSTWQETEVQVKGYSGNRYQGFTSLSEATRAYRHFLKDGEVVPKSKRTPNQNKPMKQEVNNEDNLPPWELD